MITAQEARNNERHKYNEEKVLKRIEKDIKKAIRAHKRSVGYEDFYMFDFHKTEYVIDHTEELENLGYGVETWGERHDGTVIKFAEISW